MYSSIIFLILLSALNTNADSPFIANYARLVSLDSIVPFVPVTLGAVVDFGHARCYATGLYTTAQMNAIDTGTENFLLNTFNFNMSNAVSYEGCLVLGTTLIMCPYSIGLNVNYPANQSFSYGVTFDSNDLFIGLEGNFNFVGCGNVIVMLQNGVVNGGTQNGSTYNGLPLTTVPLTSDALGYANYNFLRQGADWSRPINRRQFWMQTPWFVHQYVNQYGDIETINKVQLMDPLNPSGPLGFGILNTINANIFGQGYSSIGQYKWLFPFASK